MRSRASLFAQLFSLLACAIATPLAAQMAAPEVTFPVAAASDAAPAVTAAGPTIESATLGYSNVADASSEMTWNNQQRAKNSSGPVLAIVGGAAFIGGLLIGDDAGTAIAVGGLVMGLIGLYLWLK